jgi:hypothetical protein
VKDKQGLRCWWTKAVVKKTILGLNQRTTQAMRSHTMWRIKSLLNHIGSDLKPRIELSCVGMVQATCSMLVCSRMRETWLQALMKIYWEEMAYEGIKDSSGWNRHILLMLSSIGMSYYQAVATWIVRQVTSAQTNRSPTANMRETTAQHLHLLILGCSWLGWISL